MGNNLFCLPQITQIFIDERTDLLGSFSANCSQAVTKYMSNSFSSPADYADFRR